MFFIEDVNHPGSANSAGYYIDRYDLSSPPHSLETATSSPPSTTISMKPFSTCLIDFLRPVARLLLSSSLVPNSPLYHPKPSDSLYQCLLYMLKSIHNPSTQLYMQEALYILGFLPPYPQLLENIKVINQYLDWKTLLDFRYPYRTFLSLIH